MWDLPRQGIEPVSSALAGGFLTTAPPGKPRYYLFIVNLETFSPALLEEDDILELKSNLRSSRT